MAESDIYDVTVIGAGVVGLAVAARLAPDHPGLMLLERRARHGMETSSRNSEVVHAGIYYPPGSQKALLCVEGNRRLYELCARHGIPHARLTKLIVAMRSEETAEIERLYENGRANGVELRLLTGAEARALEPHVPAVAALLSPSTGILSADALMDFLLHSALASEATLMTAAEVVGLTRRGSDYEIVVRRGTQDETFTSQRVVNAAGLGADTLAALAGIDLDQASYRAHYWKGSYFAARSDARGLISRLVYQVPSQTSLGVHVVLDLAGRLRFGPDAEYLADRRIDYAVDPTRRAAFAQAARLLLPDLRDDDLVPDTSGVRPKLQAPGEPARDFVIAEESARGLPGLVNLIGIDSPGLTAALAIAERVARLLG
jgi:L-2-hydroxyglutarate oxidase LhgO